jgi:recombination protein RecR
LLIAEPLHIAIEELSKLPGIGKKTAQRLALYLLKSTPENVDNLLNAIQDLKTKIHFAKDVLIFPKKIYAGSAKTPEEIQQ